MTRWCLLRSLPLIRALACLAMMAVFPGCGSEPAPGSRAGEKSPKPEEEAARTADLILRGGRIVTVDGKLSEVEALAARDGRILALGSNAEIDRLANPDTQVVELGARLTIPGFIEGHGHFMGLGDSMTRLDLREAKSWDEITALVADACARAEPGEWIRGRGWHQDKWDVVPQPSVEGFPTHRSLSAISKDNPVLLVHASGHMAFANFTAMELAGIDRTTANPPGGEILRDTAGEATGCLREAAQGLVSRVAADDQSLDADRLDRRNRKILALAAGECLSHGVTSFQDAGVDFSTIDFYKKMADEGALPVRLWVMAAADPVTLASRLSRYRSVGYGEQYLTVRGIKMSIDGALGSRGAWLIEPYSDAPGLSGTVLSSSDRIKRTAELALKHRYQLCIHAIGDRANREVLDIYEEVFRDQPEDADLRWRIEHAQHLHPGDIPRLAELSVIASVQAIHCTSDGPWVPDRIGAKRAEEGAYVWRKLLDSGAVLLNGTHVPVEGIDPIANFAAAVTRRMNDGSQFFPAQKMTRMEALQSATSNAAWGAFEEGEKGSLEVGKLADIVVLSGDILELPEEKIRETRVDLTIVGGKVVYRRETP